MKSNTRKSIILCVALAVLLTAAWLLYDNFKPVTVQGAKTITIEVAADENMVETFTIKTDEEYLGAALESEKLVEGEMGTYGLFIKTVNGITADGDKQQWWKISKDGEDVFTGADTTPIADGDKYELTLMTGY